MSQTINHDKNYQELLRKNIWLSGAPQTFFAEYQAKKLTQWFPHLQTPSSLLAVLDFGCGDGIMTSFMQALCPRVILYGMDASSEHIEIARMTYENIIFLHSDTPELPFPDKMFDFIYVADVLHHIPSNHHASYCAEIYRILKPNGIFVVLEPNPLNPITAYRFTRNPIEKNCAMLWPWYTKKLLHNQYTTVSLQFYGFFPNMFSKIDFLEKCLRYIPLGSLYACVGYKK